MRYLVFLLLAITLIGCGRKQSSESAAAKSEAPAMGAQATPPWPEHASAPRQPVEIVLLNDQFIVFECRQCNRLFDGPGKCAVDRSDLFPAKITYMCEAENRPAGRAGKCPSCGRELRILKTVMRPDGIKVMAVK